MYSYIGRYVEGVPEARSLPGRVGEVVHLKPAELAATTELDRVDEVAFVNRPRREDSPWS